MTREEAKDYIREWCPYDRQDEIIKALSNSDEDCISRQAVLEIAKSSKSNWIDNSVLFKRVNDLPPITAKPKTDVLDKIRAEIESNRNEWIKGEDAEWHTYDRCLLIIDKYKAESEDKE